MLSSIDVESLISYLIGHSLSINKK